MTPIKNSDGEHKPASITPADAAALIAARQKRHFSHLENLVARYRARGISDKEIAQAMSDCPRLVDARGRGRP